MRSDREIYTDIAKILIAYGPAGSREIKYGFWVIAEDDCEEGGAYSYEFDYIGEEGEQKWFIVENVAVRMELCDLCFELRNFMNSKAGNRWREIRLTLDAKELRFSSDFRYE